MQSQLMGMGTGVGSTASFQESPAQLTLGKFHHAKSQHPEKEFLVLERALKYKCREGEAGCAQL